MEPRFEILIDDVSNSRVNIDAVLSSSLVETAISQSQSTIISLRQVHLKALASLEASYNKLMRQLEKLSEDLEINLDKYKSVLAECLKILDELCEYHPNTHYYDVRKKLRQLAEHLELAYTKLD